MVTPQHKAAVRYVRRGLCVVPIWPDKKSPCVEWGNIRRVSEAQIDNWFRRFPRANVGIITGARSRLWVLDVDPRHGGDVTLRELERAYGALPAGPIAGTAGGGWHHYFAYSPIVTNSAPGLGAGLDVRGEGGQVVAPPSVYPHGEYSWLAKGTLPDAPAWLLALLRPQAPSMASSGPSQIRVASRYGQVALEREAQTVLDAPHGYRNRALNRAAFKLGRILAAGVFTTEQVIAVLTAVGQQAGLDGDEILPSIRSGLKKGALHPRTVTVTSGSI